MINELVSIVIPVYNAEKTLRRCIDSILCQSYNNIEIILVNDGSVDSSANICDLYTKKYKNIICINKPNKGVSNSRNVGIEHSQGKFILFVDSDDYICNNYISSLLSLYNKDNIFVIQGCRIVGDFSSVYTMKKANYMKSQYGLFIEREEMYMHGSPYGKLYLSEIIKKNNIRFDERIHNYEDLLFFLDYIQYTEEIIVSDVANYCYCISSDGLHAKYFTVEEELYLYRQYKEKIAKYISKDCNGKMLAYSLKILCRSAKSLLFKKGELSCKNLQKIRIQLDKANHSKIYLNLKEKLFVNLLKFTFNY